MDFQDIKFPATLEVTEQTIDISGISDSQKRHYFDFAAEISVFYALQKKPRALVGVCGAAGSGKSVLAEITKYVIRQMGAPFRFEHITLDAFHYTNSYLISHALKDFKGRSDTYDVEKFVDCLKKFKGGEAILFPAYSRKIHEPVESTISIQEEHVLLLVEGQWLLRATGGGGALKKTFDIMYYIDSDADKVRSGVIERHIAGGRNREDAIRQFEKNDLLNYIEITKDSVRADKTLPAYYNL